MFYLAPKTHKTARQSGIPNFTFNTLSMPCSFRENSYRTTEPVDPIFAANHNMGKAQALHFGRSHFMDLKKEGKATLRL